MSWTQADLLAFERGDAGPMWTALRRTGAWTTLDAFPDLWARALDHTAAVVLQDPRSLANARAGTSRFSARPPDGEVRPGRGPSHAEEAKWRAAWMEWAGGPQRGDFRACIRVPVLKGARHGARRPLRGEGGPASPTQVKEFLDDLNVALPVLVSHGGTSAAWRDLATSVLAGGRRPFVALQRVWGARGPRVLVQALLDSRRSTAQTLQVLWPSPPLRGRAAAAGRLMHAHPDGLQALAELHAWLRAVASGPSGGTHGATMAWDTTRLRVRRAVMDAPATDLVQAVLAVNPLAVASAHAAFRYGRRRADAARVHGLFDDLHPLVEPCAPRADPASSEALRTWVLLVVLRGQVERLLSWVGISGGMPAEGGDWQRLMKLLPGPVLPGRIAVALTLPEVLAEWLPWLELVARQPPGRDLKPRLTELLRPVWGSTIALPDRGYPAMVKAARQLIARWDPEFLSLLPTQNLGKTRDTPPVQSATMPVGKVVRAGLAAGRPSGELGVPGRAHAGSSVSVATAQVFPVSS